MWRCPTPNSTSSRNHSAHGSCLFFSHEQKLRPDQLTVVLRYSGGRLASATADLVVP